MSIFVLYDQLTQLVLVGTTHFVNLYRKQHTASPEYVGKRTFETANVGR